jgi:hypothetical protein
VIHVSTCIPSRPGLTEGTHQMQSTGHVATASATVSSESPPCRKERARPCNGSIIKVARATVAQLVHPMHLRARGAVGAG